MKYNLKFTHLECQAIAVGVRNLFIEMVQGQSDPTIPFTPEARAKAAVQIKVCKEVLDKVCGVTGLKFGPDYTEDEMQQFMTKPS